MLHIRVVLKHFLLLVNISRCFVTNGNYHHESLDVNSIQGNSEPILSCKRIKVSSPNNTTLRSFNFLVHYDPISENVYYVSSDDSSIQYILYQTNFKYMASEYVLPDNKFSDTLPYVDNLGLAFYSPSIAGYSCSSDICIYNLYSDGPYYLSFSSNGGDLMESTLVQLLLDSCPLGLKPQGDLHHQQQLSSGVIEGNLHLSSQHVDVESKEKTSSLDSNVVNTESEGFTAGTCNQVSVMSTNAKNPFFTFLVFFDQETNVVTKILSYDATTTFDLYAGSLVFADNLFFQTSPNFDNTGVAFVAPAISGYNCSYMECIYNVYNNGSTFLAYGRNNDGGHFFQSEVHISLGTCSAFVTIESQQGSFSPSSPSTEASSTSSVSTTFSTLFLIESSAVIGQVFKFTSPTLTPSQLTSTIPSQTPSDLKITTEKVTLLSVNPSVAPFLFSITYNAITGTTVSIFSNDSSDQYLLSDFNTADNKFFPTSPFFDNFGLSFSAPPPKSYDCSESICQYNIYSVSPEYYLAYSGLQINSPSQLAKVQVCIGDNCPEVSTTSPFSRPSHNPSITPSLQPTVTTAPTFQFTAQPSVTLQPTALASSALPTSSPSNSPTHSDLLLSCSRVTVTSTSRLHPIPFAFLISFNPITNIVSAIYSNDTKSQYILSFFNTADNNFFSAEPYFDNLGILFNCPSILGYGCSASRCYYNIFSSTSYHIASSSNGVNNLIISSDISINTTPSNLCAIAASSVTPSITPTLSTLPPLSSLSPTALPTRTDISNYISSEFFVTQSVKGVASNVFFQSKVNNSLVKAVQTVLKGPFSPVMEQVIITSITPLTPTETSPTQATDNPGDLTVLRYTVTYWAPSVTLLSTYYSALTNTLTTSTNNGALQQAFNTLCDDCTTSSTVFLAPEFASSLTMPSIQPVYTPLTLTPNQNAQATPTNSIQSNFPIIISVVVITALCILIFCTLITLTTRKQKLRRKKELERWRGNTSDNLNMNSIYTLEAEGNINLNIFENQNKSRDGRSSRHSSSADESSLISEDNLGIIGPLPDVFPGSRSRASSVAGIPSASAGRCRPSTVSRSRSTSRLRGHSISISLAANSEEDGNPQTLPSQRIGTNDGHNNTGHHNHNDRSHGITSPEYPSFSAYCEPLPCTWVDAEISSTSPDDPSATRL